MYSNPNIQPKPKRHWRSKRYPATITIRCSETEYKKLAEQATNHALSISRYCVWAGKRAAPPPPPEETEKLKRLLYDLHKLANNVNQLAHTLHASRGGNGLPPSAADIATAATSVGELIAELRAQI
jgi:hypothetical protein